MTKPMIFIIIHIILCTQIENNLGDDMMHKTNDELFKKMDEIISDLNEKLLDENKFRLFLNKINTCFLINNPHGITKLNLKKINVCKFSWEGHLFVSMHNFIIHANVSFHLLLNDVFKVLKKMKDCESDIFDYILLRFPNKSKSLRKKALLNNFYNNIFDNIDESIEIFINLYNNFCNMTRPAPEYLDQFDSIVKIFYDSLTYDTSKNIEVVEYWKKYFKFENNIELKILDYKDSKKIIQSDFQTVFCSLFLDRSLKGNILKNE